MYFKCRFLEGLIRKSSLHLINKVLLGVVAVGLFLDPFRFAHCLVRHLLPQLLHFLLIFILRICFAWCPPLFLLVLTHHDHRIRRLKRTKFRSFSISKTLFDCYVSLEIKTDIIILFSTRSLLLKTLQLHFRIYKLAHVLIIVLRHHALNLGSLFESLTFFLKWD